MPAVTLSAATRQPSPRRYTTTAVILHWAVAAIVVALIALGWWMQSIPKQPAGPRVDAFNLHKSLGLLVLALMAVRLAWRASHPPPARPGEPRWQARSAGFVHRAFYACLFIQPLSGYLGSAFSGYPVKWFGVALPSWLPANPSLKDAMSTVHLVDSWVLVVLVGAHLLAVAKHVFLDGDRLVRRMWF